MMWTPLQIQMVLDAYSLGSGAKMPTQTHKDQMITLLTNGIIENIDDVYRTTSKGECFVKLLRNTPLPVNTWVDPRNGESI